MSNTLPYHCEETVLIDAPPEQVFAFVDDHNNLSSHMNQSSMMMAGSKMDTHVDQGHGQQVGSHITMDGKVLGIPLSLDEVVIRRQPPSLKTWETVGHPRLLVMGNYQMGFEITPQGNSSNLKVFIDYQRPAGGGWLLGFLFGGIYAKWCVRQMTAGVQAAYDSH